VVELCGARPVFVDITPDTWTMDPARLSEAFVGHPRLRAIIPVDAFGGMADMQSICGSAAERGVPVVEDAACALGASLHGRMAGSWGQLGCLSFHPRKAVTTGEGGAVTGDDAPEIHAVRRLRNHGQDLSSGAPDFRAAGFNMRLTEFQAALGVAQLKKLERLLTARIDRAQRYDQLLHEVPVTRPFALPGSRHVYQSYVVLLPPDSAARRDSIIRSMRAQDVEVQIGTHHIPGLTYYRRKYPGPETCAVSADVAARAIALPLHAGLSADDQERVVRALRSQL
jgi:dTDP-4-amino-4,6-dideoxygalactose transaminase